MRSVYDGLSSGAITDYDEAVGMGASLRPRDWASCMWMTNGVITPLTDNYEHEIMAALSTEHRHISSSFVAYSPARRHLPSAYYTLPRYSRELLLPAKPFDRTPSLLEWLPSSQPSTETDEPTTSGLPSPPTR